MEFNLNANQLQAAGTACWLVKDLGWVLVLPELSGSAALLALYLEGRFLVAHWGTQGLAMRVHYAAVFLWLAGNVVWMTSEMLFESSPEMGRHFPWSYGPLAGVHEHAALMGVRAAQTYFLASLAILVVFYAASVFKCLAFGSLRWCATTNGCAEPSGGLVFGFIPPEVYQIAFVGPWILKDFIWTLDMVWPSLPCVLLSLVIVADCFRRYRGVTFLAEILWMLGNTVWIVDEIRYRDRGHGPRILAASILFLSSALALLPVRDAFGVKSTVKTPLLAKLDKSSARRPIGV